MVLRLWCFWLTLFGFVLFATYLFGGLDCLSLHFDCVLVTGLLLLLCCLFFVQFELGCWVLLCGLEFCVSVEFWFWFVLTLVCCWLIV